MSHITFALCPSYIPGGFGFPTPPSPCNSDSHLCLDSEATEASCVQAHAASTCVGKLEVGHDSSTGMWGVKFDGGIDFSKTTCTTFELVFNYNADLSDEEPLLTDMEVIYKQGNGCEAAELPGLSCDHTCSDHILNQDEENVDCGGVCPDCQFVDSCATYFINSDGQCSTGAPIPEINWGTTTCTPNTPEAQGDCEEICCDLEADIPVGDCPDGYCSHQQVGTDTETTVTLDPATFQVAPCDEPNIPCNIGSQVIATQGDDPSVGNVINPFNNGQPLPAGNYRVTYIDGCMKYNYNQWWAVNARENANRWFVVADGDRSARVAKLPGSIGYSANGGCPRDNLPNCTGDINGFETYAECVADNKAAAATNYVEFSLASPTVIGSWLADNPYSDNVSGSSVGGIGPIWKLEALNVDCSQFQP